LSRVYLDDRDFKYDKGAFCPQTLMTELPQPMMSPDKNREINKNQGAF